MILEKPATANLFELLELKDIAEEKHLILVEASTVNYFPVIRQIKKDMALIGNVHIASCNFSQYSSRYDRFLIFIRKSRIVFDQAAGLPVGVSRRMRDF